MFNNLIKLELKMNKNKKLLGLAHSQRGATTTILDSKHISPTIYNSTNKGYDIKLVEIGNYVQLYMYETKKLKKKKDKDIDLELKKEKINKMFDNEKETNTKNSNELTSEISQRSIIRSKLECQRIAKANDKVWETFITLTFEENITDIESANKKFRYFVDKVRRIRKDFKYICIPEFQKRGAVHYHLLTNIPMDSKIIPKREKLKLWNKETKSYKELEYYDIKYWNEGFSSAEPIKDNPKKIIGYISKYMTKDIDNRLFNKHRYFYSQNLNKPKESYIDLENEDEYNYYIKKIQDLDLISQKDYINPYDNTNVSFLEFYKSSKLYTTIEEKERSD